MNKEEKIQKYIELMNYDYEKCNKSYFHYLKSSWKIIEPKTKLVTTWFHELIAEYLIACYKRQIKRLIINIPPRHLKSSMVTITFPTWVWTQQPDERFLFASYSDSLATKHSIDRRTIIESRWYKNKWGNKVILSSDQNQKTEYQNTARGHMTSTSLGGSATGKGGNFLIIDDPHDVTRVESDTMRENDILNYDLKFTTRLDDKNKGVIIIIMQRIHDNDLTGHLLKKLGYEHLCIPIKADENKTYIFPISKKKKEYKENEILHIERYSQIDIDEKKKDLGSYGFAGQYMQLPSPIEGGIIKKEYWKYYQLKDLPAEFDEIIDSWDMAFKDKQTNSKTACSIWGIKGANRYLLYAFWEHMNINQAIKRIKKNREEYNITLTLIEDKANGPATIQLINQELSAVKEFNPGSKSKVERVMIVEKYFESGNIYLPTRDIAKFNVDDLIDICAKFPNTKDTDIVDTISQLLLYIENHNYYNMLKDDEEAISFSDTINKSITYEQDFL